MIRLTSLDIDGIDDGPITEVNFADQSGIIISDGTTSHCAGIDVNGVDPATNTISLNPNHAMPAAFNAANLRAVPAVVYEIQPGSTNLRRNGALMSSTVEDQQVEFWDTATPLQNPVYDLNDPLNGVSPSTVSRVRLSVVSTSTQVDTGSSKEFGGGQRPAIANRAAGPLDNLQRRVFTATVMPRNISTLP
jgi:hypothetical protein